MAGGARYLAGALAGAVLCLWSPAAAGDWREVHKLGVEALEAGRWADAERFFRAAIAERGDERVGTILGRRYLPHYYLGVALDQQGDCRQALNAWSESARQGKIDKDDELAQDLQSRRDRCRDHLQQVDERKAEIEGLLAQAEGAEQTLGSLAARPPLLALWAGGGDRSFAARQRTAAERLEDARWRLASGFEAANLKALEQARSLADEALGIFRTTINDARRELGELSAATAAALESLEEAAVDAAGSLRSIADLKPYPPELGRRAAAVERVLATVERSKDLAQADELGRLEADLKAEVERLRSAARRPPRTLTNAVEAFFDGRYGEVIGLLAEARFREVRSRLQICLLGAASRHALFVLGGGEDTDLRDQAIRDVLACRELAPELVPDRKYFSPRFAEFYAAAALAPEPEGSGAGPPVEVQEPAAEGAGPAEPRDLR